MSVLVDTNIPIRATDGKSSDHSVANLAVQRLIDRGESLVVVPQVLYEWWVVATRPIEVNGLGIDAASALSLLETIESTFRLLPDERALYERWRWLVVANGVSGKKAHDFRLIAAMQTLGINRLLTFNVQDFARFQSLTVIQPSTLI